MLNNLDTSIAVINEEQLEAMFNDTPEKTVNADDLLGGKEKPKDKEAVVVQPTGEEIESVDDLEALLAEETEKKPKAKDKKEETESEEEEIVEETGDKKKKKDKEEAAKTEEEEQATDTEEDAAVKEVLKNTVDFLVKKGFWADWEGREDLEIDPEMYGQIAAKQDEHRLQKMFSELVDSTGDYGKAIINFVKDGGDPDQIIDIFKEQKQVENFDTTSEEGKKLLISKYYKDVLNWKPEKVERHIAGLIARDELEVEAADVKESFEQKTKEDLKRINQEREAFAAQERAKEERFKENITTAIKSRKDFTDKEKKLLEQSVLSYNNKLPNGAVVSDFYVKFAEMQSDPNEYIDFVAFVMDKKAYLEKQKTAIKNKVVDETFDFIKGNTALSTKKGSSHDTIKRQDKDLAEFNFGIGKK